MAWSLVPCACHVLRPEPPAAPPAAGDNGFPTFTECCQKGWNKTEADTVRGDGLNSTECYLADKVFDPPCYVPYQNLARKQCVLTADKFKCYSGGRQPACGLQVHARQRPPGAGRAAVGPCFGANDHQAAAYAPRPALC
jgi:hypothetical protein